MKKLLLSIAALSMMIVGAKAQDAAAEKPSVKLGGFLRTEAFYDTRASVDSRDGLSYTYPKAKKLDAEGKDINDVDQFEMLAMTARLKCAISGGTAFNAKLSGLIEADFTGSAEDYKYMFYLRHAYAKLDWEKTSLLAGQYWHPMSIAEFMPNTLAFGSGSPYQPFIRSTQIRVTQQITDQIKVMGAISAFSTHKPYPISANTQRNAGLPDIQAQVQYGNVKELFVALTAGYKWLQPDTVSTVGTARYRAEKVIGSYNLQACVGYQLPILSIKLEANYGENMTAYGMIGGYGTIKGTKNSRGAYDYANINTGSVLIDLETKGEKVKFGVFAGYSANLGSKDSINRNTTYCRDIDMKNTYRIAPRVTYTSGPIEFGLEYLMTSAVYGAWSYKEVKNTQGTVTDNRILTTIKYTF